MHFLGRKHVVNSNTEILRCIILPEGVRLIHMFHCITATKKRHRDSTNDKMWVLPIKEICTVLTHV